MERWSGRWAEIGDEDVMLVPEAFCARSLDDAHASKVLAPITDPAERRRWEAVARTQRALLDGDPATLREMLTTWHDWPIDTSVRRWVERLRQRCGVVAEGVAAHG
jgi:hypothetical protein